MKKESLPQRTLKLERHLKNQLVLSSAEVEEILGSRTEIRRHVDAGYIFSLGSGYYHSSAIDPFSAMVIAASRYYPKAVISGLAALVVHGFSDESLQKIDVDIARGTSLRNRLLNVHRVGPSRLIGVTKLKFCNTLIRVYDVERTLSEAYKIDPTGAIFFKAVKRYLDQREPDFFKIDQYDKQLKTRVLAHVRQELADA